MGGFQFNRKRVAFFSAIVLLSNNGAARTVTRERPSWTLHASIFSNPPPRRFLLPGWIPPFPPCRPRRQPGSPTMSSAVCHRWTRSGTGKRLAVFAPAFTGSSRHNNFVNMLDAGLKESGYETHRQTFKLPYWEPIAYGLTIADEKVHVPGYRPYSGPTGPEGVSGALVYAGKGNKLDFSSAKGKIAIVEVPFVGDGFYKNNDVISTVPPGMDAAYHGDRANACISGMFAPNLDAAVKAGAAGVIYVWDVSDGNAQDQVQPFFAVPISVPTIWVGRTTGERLKAEAVKGTRVNLTLYATVHPDTPSDTLWTTLPGMSDDVIIVNTHTDGCNACEENGGIAVMSWPRRSPSSPRKNARKLMSSCSPPAISRMAISAARRNGRRPIPS